MIVLTGADIVLPDRVLSGGSLLIDGDRIVAIESRVVDGPEGATRMDLSGAIIVPGFIDVHVHGVQGIDVLDGPGAIADVARRLTRFGVTAFCPTSIACAPQPLADLLAQIEVARASPGDDAARVLPAHLESNFINPEYKGAQPLECLRTPSVGAVREPPLRWGDYAAEDILDVITAHRESVGIVTVAPEIDGGLDLVQRLTAAGHIVSIGHSGATYEQALEAIEMGVCHATHLFNRMTALSHRAPGVPGAVLQSEAVAAEIICDGFHVHPALVALATRIKGPHGVMAITDGTAGSGLQVGTRARLGGRPIIVTDRTAELDDGTLAGSVLTMDGAFRMLLQQVGASVVEAARMCSSTPAEQLGLSDLGRIAVGAIADLTVLDSELRVKATFVGGRLCT